jgi:hypothetical protein
LTLNANECRVVVDSGLELVAEELLDAWRGSEYAARAVASVERASSLSFPMGEKYLIMKNHVGDLQRYRLYIAEKKRRIHQMGDVFAEIELSNPKDSDLEPVRV